MLGLGFLGAIRLGMVFGAFLRAERILRSKKLWRQVTSALLLTELTFVIATGSTSLLAVIVVVACGARLIRVGLRTPSASDGETSRSLMPVHSSGVERC